jgi:hypothetical protein
VNTSSCHGSDSTIVAAALEFVAYLTFGTGASLKSAATVTVSAGTAAGQVFNLYLVFSGVSPR